MTTTKKRRFELRTDEATDQLIAEAADLLYVTKSAFVADAARQAAEKVVARSDVTLMSPVVFDTPPPLDRAAIERAASRQARRHGSISAPQLASCHAKDFAANSSWPCIGILVARQMAGGSHGSSCAAKVG